MPKLQEVLIWGSTNNPNKILYVKEKPEGPVSVIPTKVESCFLQEGDKVYINPNSPIFKIYAIARANCPFNPLNAVNHCQAVQLPTT